MKVELVPKTPKSFGDLPAGAVFIMSYQEDIQEKNVCMKTDTGFVFLESGTYFSASPTSGSVIELSAKILVESLVESL